MKSNICKALLVSAALFSTLRALAQYSIDSFTVAGGSGTVSGGTYSISGTVGQPDGNLTLSGGLFSMSGGFWSVVGADAGPPTETIFDNTGGEENGYGGALPNTWLASKFCLGSQPYQLDSVSLLLSTGGRLPLPSTVRLQIYSNDPVSGTPSTSTGLIMNLSGLTNPITVAHQLVKWTPATPFILSANKCYWAVLSVESGDSLSQIGSVTLPTGDAGALGGTRSQNAGATWEAPNNFVNNKMLIRGTASPAPPALVVSAVSISGNELRLSFPTSAGQTYALESRAGLGSGDWAEVPGTRQTSAGAALQLIVPIALEQPQQYFRVKQLP